MRDINQVILKGRVAKISDVRYTRNKNSAVCDIVVAVNTYYNEGSAATSFVKCTLMGATAERAVEQLRVSDTVLVKGCIVGDDIPLENGRRTSGRHKLDKVSFDLIQQGKRTKEQEDDSEDGLL